MWYPTRRDLVRQAGSAALIAASATSASAESAADWPSKPVRIVVNFAAGGGTDNAIRPYIEKLSKVLGQQVVIDNKGGASGAIGIESVIKSPPDGYTFLATPSLSIAILPHLRKVSYDPLKDIVPVTMFTEGMMLLAVEPSIPSKTVPEFVAYLKERPGKLSWGTAGIGSMGHLMCESFKHEAGVDILHVPYRGTAEALNDFLAGVVQIHADPITLAHVPSGKAKLLAVVGRERRPDFPQVPTLKEIYPALDFIVWFALFAPPGTPQPIVDRTAAAFNTVAADVDLKQVLHGLAMAPNPGSPAELVSLLAKDHDRFGRIIREFNIRAE